VDCTASVALNARRLAVAAAPGSGSRGARGKMWTS